VERFLRNVAEFAAVLLVVAIGFAALAALIAWVAGKFA
jgi:hypothetical protein